MNPDDRDRHHPNTRRTRSAPSDSERPPTTVTGDYTSAVYGSVLAAMVVITVGDQRAPSTLALILLASGLLFWIAHVYAATVASRRGGWHTGSIAARLRHEWPVAFAAVPPAIAAAVCGWIPAVSVTGGVWVALVVTIGEQQLWSYAAIQHTRPTGARAGTILLNALVGFLIVVLMLAVGH